MELWLKWAIPFVLAVAVFAVPIAAFSKRIPPGWLRIMLRIVGCLAAFPLALATIIFVLMAVSETDGPLFGSPNQQYVARTVTLDQGDWAKPSAKVIVRHAGSPVWSVAATGIGWKRLPPRVQWLDDSHLHITYPAAGFKEPTCAQRAAGIVITCDVQNY